MEKTAEQIILEAVKGRTEGGPFGYGITTADKYVGEVAKCTNSACFKRFGNVDLGLATKAAAKRLVYANDGMKWAEKYTCGNWKSVLPASVAEQIEKNSLTSIAMVFKNIVTTKSEDRDRDVLHTAGAQVDMKMPFLWQHIHTLPIGKMLMIDEHTDDFLKVWTVLFDMNELTHDAAILIENDALRISHGFIPKSITERQFVKNDPDERMPGFDIKTFEIMEESGVSVPSNVEAEIELYAAGKFKSDVVKSRVQPMFEERPRVWPGFDGLSEEGQKNVVDAVKLLAGLGRDESNKPSKESGCTCKSTPAETAKPTVDVLEGKTVEKDGKSRKGVYVELVGSYEWVRQKLRNKLMAKMEASFSGEDISCYIEGTYADHIVVEKYNWDTQETTFYQVGWKLGEDRMPELNGVPVEVEISSGVTVKSDDMKLNTKQRVGLKGLSSFLSGLELTDDQKAELGVHAEHLDELLKTAKQTEHEGEQNPGVDDSANPGVSDNEDGGNDQPTGEAPESVETHPKKPADVNFSDVVQFVASANLDENQRMTLTGVLSDQELGISSDENPFGIDPDGPSLTE